MPARIVDRRERTAGILPEEQEGEFISMKTRIMVLFGGNSSEYEVSLQSGAAVLDALDRERYEVFPVGITRQGRWLAYSGTTEEIRQDTWEAHSGCRRVWLSPEPEVHGCLLQSQNGIEVVRLDAVFPVLHGKNGEDGTVQGICGLAGIPVVGCGILSSALCMDKHRAHRLAAAGGIAVPKGRVIRRSELLADGQLPADAADGLRYPLFVKPVKSGSSFGVSRIEAPEELERAAVLAFERDGEILVEEAVDGFEVGCAILGTSPLTVGEVDEIELAGDLFDYTEKYNLITSRIHMPARITAGTAQKVKETAVKLYRLLGCSGFARVDLFLCPDGTLVFNEVNTIPGFTSHSRYPNMMKGIGWSFERVVNTLAGLAAEP